MRRPSLTALVAQGLTVARFGMVGGLVTLLNYLAFVGLQRLGWHYLVAATTAWALSVTVNFLLSRRLTFGLKGQGKPREVGLFVGGNLVQLGLGLTLYGLLIGVMKIDATLAFICNGVVVASLSFFFMRFVVFPHTQEPVS